LNQHFQEADVCVLSSQLDRRDVSEMIDGLRSRCYNVAGVFWSNSYDNRARDITALPWNELLRIENPLIRGDHAIAEQLDRIAKHFSELLLDRARAQ
jgi:hypothetical protein